MCFGKQKSTPIPPPAPPPALPEKPPEEAPLGDPARKQDKELFGPDGRPVFRRQDTPVAQSVGPAGVGLKM